MHTVTFEIWKYKPGSKRGFVTFDRMATHGELLEALKDYLSLVPWDECNACERFDYISILPNRPEDQLPVLVNIFADVVEGSSEGYYFHISGFDRQGKNHNAVTLKFFGTMEDTLRMLSVLQRFIFLTQ
jgi:hypothetical protein